MESGSSLSNITEKPSQLQEISLESLVNISVQRFIIKERYTVTTQPDGVTHCEELPYDIQTAIDDVLKECVQDPYDISAILVEQTSLRPCDAWLFDEGVLIDTPLENEDIRDPELARTILYQEILNRFPRLIEIENQRKQDVASI